MQIIREKEKKRVPGFLFLAILAAVVSVFSSCATAPFTTESRLYWADFLPQGSDILGKLEIADNEPLAGAVIREFLEDADLDLSQILSRTDVIFFTTSGESSGSNPGSFVVLGKFPPGIVKRSLKKDSSWVNPLKGIEWWENGSLGLQIAVPAKNVIFISGGKIDEMIERYRNRRTRVMNPEVRHEMEVSDALIYLEHPEKSLLSGFSVGSGKLPLRDAWFSLLEVGGEYELNGVFTADSEQNAKKLSGLVKLVLVGLLRQHQLMDIKQMKESLQVLSSGNSVRVSGLTFSVQDTIKLIGILLPSGKPGE